MATLLLQAAGAYVGGLFGGLGVTLGTAAGALAGYVIDRALFQGSVHRQGPRLSDQRPFSAEEGAALPRVYGTARIGGNLIWATRFEESRETTRQGFKGGARTTTYSYFANLAFAICEGEIAGIRRIWADGREIDQTQVEIRIYTGSDSQDPDPLIEAKQGTGNAPAYRGTAYVVMERLPIGPYGNRVPQFQFEVIRTVGALGERVKAMALIPGSTEYGLSPTLVTRSPEEGETVAENRHVLHAGTDLMASLDELQAVCPNLEHVALVVSWFGSDLRAGQCVIRPAVTDVDANGFSAEWKVSGVARPDAIEVSTLDGKAAFGGTPSDSSVMDAIAEIKARGLKVTLYPFVMMDIPPDNALADPYTGSASQPAHPWRGRITCDPAPQQPASADKTAAARTQIEQFCGAATAADLAAGTDTVVFSGSPSEWGYRRFVLHYARLAAAAGGVDAFLLGSELRGLTAVRDAAHGFPFVECLCDLASEVRSILGPATKITYGADWTEYFGHQPADGSGDVYFHLDPLWAHADVDAVGIDNYMPLADWRDEDRDGSNPDGFRGPYDAEAMRAAIHSGEGYDWYYASDADRASRSRAPIADGAYAKPWVFRYKDIHGWWSNAHYDRPGGVETTSPTGWVPRSKPIWFTELGCPAVDKGPNQPNVFPDPKSSESASPHFSDGGRSDLAPLRLIGVHFDHWDGTAPDYDAALNPLSELYGGPMVDPSRIYLWAWDARPFPAFPARSDVWSDGANWQCGHWLSGRLDSPTVGDLIAAVLADRGLPAAETRGTDGTVSGYVTIDTASAREVIEPLIGLFGIAVRDEAGMLRFETEGCGQAMPLAVSDLVLQPDRPVVEASRTPDHLLPREAVLEFRDALRDHQASMSRARTDGGEGAGLDYLGFQGGLDKGQGDALLVEWLRRQWRGRDTVAFELPPGAAAISPASVVHLPGDPSRYLVTEVEEGLSRRVSARRVAATGGKGWSPVTPAVPPPIFASSGRPLALFLDLPMGLGAGSAEEDQLRLAVRAKPWSSHAAFASPEETGYVQRSLVTRKAVIGRLAYASSGGVHGRITTGNPIHVALLDGELASITRLQLLNGGNVAAIRSQSGEWEVLQFEEAEEVSPDLWRLDGLLRGQLGTDDAMRAGAAEGAYFVLLDDAVTPAGLTSAERGLPLNWRVGAAGLDLSELNFATQVVTGGVRARLPLSPVHLRADAAGSGDLRVSWVRRGRIDADTWQSGEIPLGEESERYAISVAAAGDVLRDAETTVPEWTYAAAQVAADTGGAPLSVAIDVRQIGSAGGGIPARLELVLN